MTHARKIPAVLIGLVLLAMPSSAHSAIAAELAKKCPELAIKAQPAGSKGYEQVRRDYFKLCVQKNGDMSK
jgi:hypothetical protein